MFLLVSKIRVPFTQGFPIITSGSTLIPAGSFIRVVCPITADALKLLQVRELCAVRRFRPAFRLEGFYFAFGENAAYVIFDVPDNSTAAAISLAVAGTGVIRMKTIMLFTPEEIDQAMKKPVHYGPLGWKFRKSQCLRCGNLA